MSVLSCYYCLYQFGSLHNFPLSLAHTVLFLLQPRLPLSPSVPLHTSAGRSAPYTFVDRASPHLEPFPWWWRAARRGVRTSLLPLLADALCGRSDGRRSRGSSGVEKFPGRRHLQPATTAWISASDSSRRAPATGAAAFPTHARYSLPHGHGGGDALLVGMVLRIGRPPERRAVR